MQDGITVANTRELVRQLQRFQAHALGDVQTEVRSQFRSALRFAIQITPPGMGQESASAAKKRGEERVEADIRKIFTGGKKKDSKVRSIAALHKSQRDRRGRVRKEWKTKAIVPKGDLARYIASRKKNVGWLASGWAHGALASGTRVPAWVGRHNAPGRGFVRVSSAEIVAEAANAVPWFTRGKPDIQRHVDYALRIQARRLSREIDFLIARAARREKLAA